MVERPAKVTGAAALAVLVATLAFIQWGSLAPIRPVIVSVRQPDTSVRVFPAAGGALIILPDGSLWRWGQVAPGSRRARVPKEVKAGHKWARAFTTWANSVALDTNGVLWEWPAAPQGGKPRQVAAANDWVDVTGGSGTFSLALKRNGTLWAWASDWPRRRVAGDSQPNLVQIGTNADWIAVSSQGDRSLGLRRDGTLWSWQRVGTGLTFTPAFQVRPGTNWAGIDQEFAWTADGSVRNAYSGLSLDEGPQRWLSAPIFNGNPPNAFSVSPPPALPPAAHALAGRLAFSGPMMCEVRTDGTLWRREFPSQPGMFSLWGRVGSRSDWISIWGGGGTAYGVTADGTLWTWGVDWSHDTFPSLWTKLISLANRALANSGRQIAVQSNYVNDPWPLMRLVFPNSTSTAAPNRITQ
jgi:hypothetical protein